MRILIECGSTLNEDNCRNMHIFYGSSLNRDPYLIGILIQKFSLGTTLGAMPRNSGLLSGISAI